MTCARVTDGVIDHGPTPLPSAWENHSNFRHAPADVLARLGWLPVAIAKPAFDSATETHDSPTLAVLADRGNQIEIS